ncbi:Dynein beta chain [Diplonema papillatum]|nr:Dynein beta chain [Diplonema papillatum]
MGKGKGAEGKDDERQTDKRVTWLENRMQVALRLKPQELRKLTEVEENATAIKEFFDTADTRALFVVQKPSGTVITTDGNLPPDYKKKVFYFMKLAEGGKTQKVDLHNINKMLIFGDLHVRPLETLDQYSRNVFFPLMKVSQNIDQVPEVAQPALWESVNTYLAHVLVINGLCGGRTLLPLPPITLPGKIDGPPRDKDLLYQLESVVVAWTAQIRSAIQQAPEGMLTDGHPGPKEELEFWKSKRDNLLSLEDQLHTPKVLKVLVILSKAGSSYHRPFVDLLKELRRGAEEASDNYRFLEPIRETFCDIAEAQDNESFENLVTAGTFQKLFHYIYAVWISSKYYNTPTRLVVLIREICNDLITAAKTNVSIEDLFQCDPDEAVKRLSGTLGVCTYFKKWYFHYKNKAAKESGEDSDDVTSERPVRPWKFQNTTLFARLDAFLERCLDLLDVLETVMLFNRLEKVEIGGTHGAELSANIVQIHKEFEEAYTNFHTPEEGGYDILKVEEPRFDPDFSSFRAHVRRMEKRLGSMLTQSMDDAPALYNAFKLVDTYEGFLDRSVISQEWQKRQVDVLKAYQSDLLTVQECFQAFRDDTTAKLPVYNRMPLTSAQLIFAKGLLERITEPFGRIMELSKPILQSELAVETVNLQRQLSNTLKTYIHSCSDRWAGHVGTTSSEKLKLNLLSKDEGPGVISVNFDKELVKMLREINYLEILNASETQEDQAFVIPPQAMTLYKMRDQFRCQILKLELITSTFNSLMSNMLDVEKPLMVQELQQIDEELQRGLKRLNWHSPDIDEFIDMSSRSVEALDHVFATLKNNAKLIRESLTEYCNEDKFLPINPKESKTMSVDDFQKKYQEQRKSREKNLTERGKQMHDWMADSLATVNTLKQQLGLPQLETDTECWVAYVSYINDIVRELVCSSVVHSLKNLRDQVNTDWLKENDGLPLLDVKLVLTQPSVLSADKPEARFTPHLSSKEGTGSVDTIVNEWIKDYNDTAQCITRLDTGDDSYAQDVYSHKEANTTSKQINELITISSESCHKYSEQFLQYSDLWEKDLKKHFQTFLQPPQVAAEGDDADERKEGNEETKQNEFFSVSLDQFDHEISKYEKLLEKINDLPPSATVGWLRVDSKPMRESLKDCCRKWIDMYTGYIVEKIENELNSHYTFIEQADGGLDEDVTDGKDGEEALRRVLKHIRDCRVRDVTTRAMFDPISQGIQLLRQHSDSVSEKQITNLDELRKEAPDKWTQVMKKVFNVRSGNGHRQDTEAMHIKGRALEMEEQVLGFRMSFKTLRPFQYNINVEEAYGELMSWNQHLNDKEVQAKELNEVQELFDLTPTELVELKECRHELLLLKQLWDLVGHVKSQFADWMSQTFKLMQPDDLIEEVKKIQKQMKSMPLKCKATGTFNGLETEVKDMLTTLPLVAELRNQAMRERHWRQLLKKCDVDSQSIDPESDSFSLKDLLSLGLHNYVEDVGNIVEKATKELKIEKDLQKVSTFWDNEAHFAYEFSQGINCYLLSPVDEIVEVLEEHLNILQTMQSNRFVEEFADQVNKWQGNLGMVETSMVKWMEIQKMWKNLYPIFIESADIREQLQEDARAFQGADDLYRTLMSKVHAHSAVIEVCCSDLVKKLLQRDDDFETLLNTIDDTLNTCQKKLTEYLEGKKKLFARFFFISNADLIDILSKGSDPVAVMRHMSKIIDSVKTFTIKEGTKTATQLNSIQGEVVPACNEYECEGPVEEWLNGCVDLMFQTIKMSILDGHTTYVESPRIEWVMKRGYPGQTIIVASRIWFTSECEQAFAQLEDGNETALKDFYKQQEGQIRSLINIVLTKITSNERKMLVHLITIDVHARDVIGWMLDEKAESQDTFTWQSQLRYSWDDKKGSIIDICDASFINGYEYIGLCGCLVITKLTDRCYITLSQALRLVKGGAPAGPAGTGKTETTKDLARNLGIACYVFNCSDQMDYLSLGQIFKGLSMSGSWGCFDEFNRIPIQVLSVVATQVGSILNAVKLGKKRFRFMDEEISLIPNVGMWITMNPGYAGRTELPENIKSLFRPCAMCVPDLKNICEIMLAAEGFQDAKDLALKFVTLYKLNKELLSPQAHYDWGLRAVKSVLYIAGALKRGDPDVPERAVLMRALRDTNMAKLSRDDVFVFMGLIRALFPNLDVPPKSDPKLREACKTACEERKLLRGENEIFILRCVQYAELLDVRHSVFVMGPAACGKTQCWMTLSRAFRLLGDPCDYKVMNPKAVTSDELYGFIHPQSREWKDGLLSNIFRDYAELSQTKTNSKWIVLDGIIDAEWIESMNTVMDDNRMLTLASNERIPLTASMRMIFEISDLKNASPATVSRAGIIYINDTDLGWGPFKDKWIMTREDDKERTYLDNFFDKYVSHIFEWYKRTMKPPVAISDLSIVQTIVRLLDGLLVPENILPGSPSEQYEKYFLFALIWAFGGPLSSDGRIDYRTNFSNWWKKEFPAIRLTTEEKQSIFDTFIPDKSDDKEFVPWSNIVEKYKHSFEKPFADISIDTIDTTRLSFMMRKLMVNRHPVIFVGTAGTGKSNIILKRLNLLDPQDWVNQTIAFNAMTQPKGLQSVMEQKLEKKHGKTFGPPGKKRLIFFVDDLNMPAPDKYGTQEAIAFLRQHMDYQYWYDRVKPGFPLKEIASCQYVAAMNPKSGTFTVLDRLLWHFSMFACSMPDEADLMLIYGSIMKGHWGKWSKDSRGVAEQVTHASVKLHKSVTKTFLPTAIKFHYQWNMREMFNIFQGLCNSVQREHDKPSELIRLWAHECDRTFRDRMTDETDTLLYDDLLKSAISSSFGDIKADDLSLSPGGVALNLWAPFGVDKEGNEGILKDMSTLDELFKYLSDRLTEYNDTNVRMELVLFEQAIQHICRICRVMSNPRGNAMLVGVGGSGKQSLSRLSSFICGLEKYQIIVTAKYGINEFRLDLQGLYMKCGQKNMQFCFIITDGQIVAREMLVYLNDLLNSGNIPDLFPPDEMEGLQGSMVNEAKSQGIVDLSPTVLWQFFINKVRSNLHTILCFSPVGEQFSTWCRQFPALANTTVIDWFHPWPEEALVSVAQRFLSDVELNDCIDNIAEHMAFCHEKVTEKAKEFLNEEKRYCYTTPKSFLELISLYKVLLEKKRHALNVNKERLSNGIDKIKMASSQVADLQEKLKKEQVVVAEKAQYTQRLLEHVGKEKAIVSVEQEKAEGEEQKTNKVFVEAEALAAECARDLQAASPIVEEALAALNSLRKEDLTELKALAKPPSDVELVAASVMVLTADPKKIPPMKARDWSASKKMMANITGWMKDLSAFDAQNIPQACIDALQVYVNDPAFVPASIRTKSQAAAGLCSWVVNMNKYHQIRCEVKPKEEKLAESQERLTRSKAELKKVQDRVAELNAKLAGLVKQFEEASEETRIIEMRAKKTQEKANLAERLVGGLADEKIRWAKTIEELSHMSVLLIGDVLLSAAFVSYIGPFSKPFRTSIMEAELRPNIVERKIPHTPDLDIVTSVLTSDAEVAGWQNEELKSDRLSIENGALVVNCTRWPLLIDPQMQGIKWIKTREEKNGIQVCQPTQKNYIDVVIRCLEDGLPCLIENLGETVDPILEPVLGRSVTKKGSQFMIKLGDKECTYNQKFKLYLQTRLNNPHYKPEMNAQSTLINFMVTPEGLEDQLLAVVVNKERPDLEESRVTLLRRMNQMTIDLQNCEQNLLEALAAATGDILENVALIENLEYTKKKAAEISKSMIEAKLTQKEIGTSRLSYTAVAIRGSLLFFQIDQLAKINHMYQYSLTAYMVIFLKAIMRAQHPEDPKDLSARCEKLIESITQTIFAFTSRGLFERHKLIFSALLCFAIMLREGKIDRMQLAHLLRGPKKPGIERPEAVEAWLPEANWQAVQALKEVEGTNPPFEQLERDMVDSNRWKAWCELEHPEDKEEGRMPTDWKNLTDFQRLLVLRALRPDRLTVGLTEFVSCSIGSFYVEDMAVPLAVSYEDSTPVTPVFFILSPGVDPVAFVVSLGKKLGFSEDQDKLFNVSLGQGQEPRAFHALEESFKNGGWAMLNNIHLVDTFCRDLEKRLDLYEAIYVKMDTYDRKKRERRLARKKAAEAEAGGVEPEKEEVEPEVEEPPVEGEEERGPEEENEEVEGKEEGVEDPEQHEVEEEEEEEDDDDEELVWEGPKGNRAFRVFLSAEPSKTIPIGILQRSIKLTNEPPSGIRANMVRALGEFVVEPWENSQKPTEYKAVVFAMCFFHAVVVERKKFGPQGWNRAYPFNAGDLTTCVEVFYNYEDRQKIPWDDLRYVFGEIMYGGHITDDWDRILCMSYLQNFIHAGITDELELCPGFVLPMFNNFQDAKEYIEQQTPHESPLIYGLHANAEIGFRTLQANMLFATINELQPKQAGGAGADPADDVKVKLEEIMSTLPDLHNLTDISERLDEDRSPQAHVFYQECEMTNNLRMRVHSTLAELDLGLKGALSMSAPMVDLFDCIFVDKVPDSWSKVSFMSLRGLGSWFFNLLERNQQLADWTGELQTPKVTMLSYFFNPMSFLTAIMQDTAIKNSFDLDQMALVADVLKKMPDAIEYAAKDGCHVFGLFLEGARWDVGQGCIEESHMKELYPKMPVTTVRSLPTTKVDRRDQYECPLYKTQARGPGIVTGLWLKTKAPPRKWTIAGVGLLLDVVE